MDLDVKIIDPSPAFNAPWLIRQLSWRLMEHRPPRLNAFRQHLIKLTLEFQPDYVLVVGLAPVTSDVVCHWRREGIICSNYLTDDPWNPVHQSQRHFDALPQYNVIFSPRRSNLGDLLSQGCTVRYLPFGYEPAIHFPEMIPQAKRHIYECDVMFYGGADRDRVPLMKSILDAGIKLNLYGGYWERYTTVRTAAKGHVLGADLRHAVAGARVNLCLVRRANRDGHVMRTFEVPAMGGCMLAEDSTEHREIFGEEGRHVMYFREANEMIEKIRFLLANAETREVLAKNANYLVTSNPNTYYDRLVEILEYIK